LHVLSVNELTEVKHLIQIFFFAQNIEILFWTHITATIIGRILRSTKLSKFPLQLVFFFILGFDITRGFLQFFLEVNDLIELRLSLFLKLLDLLILLRDLLSEVLLLLVLIFNICLELNYLIG
jgi:hypothetical protein